MKIGVFGAGSIGCYVGGKLLAAGSADVIFVGRARVRDELSASGLSVKDFDHAALHVPKERIQFETDVAALASAEIVLCAVKSAHTDEAGASLARVIGPGVLVASLQNGVRNAERLRKQLPGRGVISSVVGFNVVSRGEGLFHRAMSGALMLERSDHALAAPLAAALRATGLTVEQKGDIVPEQWTKMLVNLNNAVSALSGAPTRTLLASPEFRHIIAAVVEEALVVLRAAGIKPAWLRGVPPGLMPKVLRLPTPLVRLVTRAQMRVDPEARSSMWEDLMKRRPTEVDDLNGEIVALAERAGVSAPINKRIVALVRDAERAQQGSPELSASALWAALSAR